ncbi:MAG TPA: hypothetical protein VMP12_12160 [Candidatus Sulfotelmatobacter sp.]|nr:hypothetical protein [Candidatus Sulfotelmatobacter sp.]
MRAALCGDRGAAAHGVADRGGTVWERILEQARAREAELIVMGVHEPEGVRGGDGVD